MSTTAPSLQICASMMFSNYTEQPVFPLLNVIFEIEQNNKPKTKPNPSKINKQKKPTQSKPKLLSLICDHTPQLLNVKLFILQ